MHLGKLPVLDLATLNLKKQCGRPINYSPDKASELHGFGAKERCAAKKERRLARTPLENRAQGL